MIHSQSLEIPVAQCNDKILKMRHLLRKKQFSVTTHYSMKCRMPGMRCFVL